MEEERSTTKYCTRVYYQRAGKELGVAIVGSLGLRPYAITMKSGEQDNASTWMPSKGEANVCPFFSKTTFLFISRIDS